MKKTETINSLRKLPGWTLAAGGKAIQRVYEMKDFLAAVALIRAVARRAQAADHHPDLHLTRYRRLRVMLTTHDAGGVTVKDFRLAAEIEALPKILR